MLQPRRRLASASVDRTVKVWDARAGQEALTLKGHTGEIRSVAFSPDGKRLASGSSDGAVRIWDASPVPEIPAPDKYQTRHPSDAPPDSPALPGDRAGCQIAPAPGLRGEWHCSVR